LHKELDNEVIYPESMLHLMDNYANILNKLDLEPKVIDFLKSEGYEELFEPQEQSVKAGLLDEKKNFLITVPTASGKTLIAMLATLSPLSKNKSKVIYLTPLRALASEKFEEFKKLEKISGSKIKVAISTGDFNSKYNELDDADIIILTNETMDAMMTFQKSEGYAELYPPQKDAVKAGVLDGKKLIVLGSSCNSSILILCYNDLALTHK
jgi:replicative superfamily II helicase